MEIQFGNAQAGAVIAKTEAEGHLHVRVASQIRPVPRRRWEPRLSLDERKEISRGLPAELSLRAIAGCLGRAPSMVSREVARNGGQSRFRAVAADRAAWHERAGAVRSGRCAADGAATFAAAAG